MPAGYSTPEPRDDSMVEGRGRRIQAPGDFAGDDGRMDDALDAAISADDADAVLRALCSGARLLVPVVAVVDEIDAGSGADGSGRVAPRDGVAGSLATHMSSVSLVQQDGRRGLLAFTCLDSLRRWDPSARPVPVLAPAAARAALDEGAHGLLVDVAGPVRFAVDGPALRRVAGFAP